MNRCGAGRTDREMQQPYDESIPRSQRGQRAPQEPQYRPAGDGRWLPANRAAREECAAWNAWADRVNARTLARLMI